MYFVGILFSLFVIYAAAEKVPFIPCKDSISVLGVAIHPCNSIDIEGWKTCVVSRQTVIRVQAAVLAPFSAHNLETVASASVNNHLIPLPHSGINPCVENIIPSCPLIKDEMYIFTFHFNVFHYYPSGRMQVLFIVRDKKTKMNLGCVKLPIVIDPDS